eukprot:g10555.t1
MEESVMYAELPAQQLPTLPMCSLFSRALPKSSVMSPDAAATTPTKSWFRSITSRKCKSSIQGVIELLHLRLVPYALELLLGEGVGFPQVGGSQFSALGVDLRGQLLQAPDCAGHYLQDLRGGVAGLSDLRAMDRRLQQQHLRLLADLLARAARSQLSLQLVEVCLLVLPQQRSDGLQLLAQGNRSAEPGWSNDNVLQWLRELKLHPYKISEETLQNCREHNIDGRLLLALDGEGLKELGVYNPLLRAKLLVKIRELDKP